MLIYYDNCSLCIIINLSFGYGLSIGWIRIEGQYYEQYSSNNKIFFPYNYDLKKMFWLVNKNGHGGISVLIPLIVEAIHG
jgi:hypothetical protein